MSGDVWRLEDVAGVRLARCAALDGMSRSLGDAMSRLDHPPKLSVNTGDMLDDFNQSHDRETTGVDYFPHPGCPHTGSRATEKLRSSKPAAQFRHQAGAVEVSRSLACGNQYLQGHHG